MATICTYYTRGARAYLSGDSADLWLKDYNCRVSSPVTILETPRKGARKVLVSIDAIDGDGHVTAYVRRSRLRPWPESGAQT